MRYYAFLNACVHHTAKLDGRGGPGNGLNWVHVSKVFILLRIATLISNGFAPSKHVNVQKVWLCLTLRSLSHSVVLHRVARLSLLCVQCATHADGHLTRSEESSDRTTKVESSSAERRPGAAGGATTTFVRHSMTFHDAEMLFVFLFLLVVYQFHVFSFLHRFSWLLLVFLLFISLRLLCNLCITECSWYVHDHRRVLHDHHYPSQDLPHISWSRT